MLPSALAFSSGVTVLIAGWLVDRFEARFVIAAGAVMAAIAFLIASSANSLTVMVGAYLLLGVAFSFGTVIPLSYVIANWFTKRRGLAMGDRHGWPFAPHVGERNAAVHLIDVGSRMKPIGILELPS